jgi:hypothetical protein
MLKIIGAVVLVIIAVSVLGAVIGFLAKAVLWIALIAGAVWVVSAVAAKNKGQIGNRR